MIKLVPMHTASAQPVLWSVLGYPFEAASMIAGLSACLMGRHWASLNAGWATLWTRAVDMTVTAIAILFTAGWIALQRPAPFYALLSGTGFGAGTIAVALAWVKRIDTFARLGADRGISAGDGTERDPASPRPSGKMLK